MIYNQANTGYRNEGMVVDGAVLAASGVTLTNSDSGRIYGGATFAVGGATVVNELGGVIKINAEDRFPLGVAVTGSAGADTLVNAGLISGSIALGDGEDRYVDRDGSEYGIDLGDGDDAYRLEGTGTLGTAFGGAGRDTVTLASTAGQQFGANLVGFEDLIIERGTNFEDFSGFLSITLPGAGSFVNLVASRNGSTDVAVTGSLSLVGSSLRTISGGSGSQRVEVGSGSSVNGNVLLGAGNDELVLSDYVANSARGQIVGAADGGEGADVLRLAWFKAGDRTFDLARITGFERLLVNTDRVGAASTTRLSNVSGFTEIDIETGGSLLLTASNLPGARVNNAAGGAFTIERGSVIGRYAPSSLFGDPRTDILQGDPGASVALTNYGAILGDVILNIGDDQYNGISGVSGGTVYGNAGNDTLLGGVGIDRFDGGAGADLLRGGEEDDFLAGGAGADLLYGGLGADTLTGGPGADTFGGTVADFAGDRILDLEVGDRIQIIDPAYSGAYSLDGSNLTLDSSVTVIIGPTVRFSQSIHLDGAGVAYYDLTVVRKNPQSDFNGDGYSDILWRNDDGTLTDWVSNGSGLVGNGAATNAVSTAWHVSGIADFNGDGRSDVLWRHNDGTLTDWLSAGPGFVGNNAATTSVATDWRVVGTGDFNGDRRDDILWRNDNGIVTDWLSSGDGFVGNNAATNAVATNWRVAGTGDFNGDGRDDILWRNSDGTVTDWLSAGEGFVGNNAATNAVTADWKIAGTGDFDGDGRDDILWRNDNGTLAEWLSAGDGFVGNSAATTSVSTDWQVAGTGDFNGDGLDDVLWRNTNGYMTEWLSTGRNFTGNALATNLVEPSWHIQSHEFLP